MTGINFSPRRVMTSCRGKHKTVFYEGIHNGIPIALGYFAVAFSLGIAARNAGLTAFEGFLASALMNASAGEYAAFVMIAADASYVEMALMMLVVNARYLLMSCALSQKFSPETGLKQRLLIGHYITDELFGITIARAGRFDPHYMYGAIVVAAPCWAIGTALGVITGNLLPISIVSALSVALYGMFLAVIIPPARKNRVIAMLVAVSFVVSFAASRMTLFAEIPDGTRTIILTVVLSVAAALLFPVKAPQEDAINDA